MCNGIHVLKECMLFLAKYIDGRLAILIEKKICKECLNPLADHPILLCLQVLCNNVVSSCFILFSSVPFCFFFVFFVCLFGV